MRHLIACAVVVGLSSYSFADTIYVPGDYPAIQTAINATTNGDTILVSPGTYYEYDINFNGKSLVIESTDGPGVTTIDAQAQGRGFIIAANEEQVVIRGFSFINTEYWVYGSNGGLRLTLDNCRFRSSAHGGVELDIKRATIMNCTFSGDMGSANKVAMKLITSLTGYVAYCQISDIASGTRCISSFGENTFSNCTFKSNSIPIGYFRGYSDRAYTISNCDFQANASDTYIAEFVDDGEIIDCTMRNNTSMRDMFIGSGASIINTSFETNTISVNDDWLIRSASVVDQCTIAGNTRGIYADGNTTISNTYFCENNNQDIYGGYVDGGGNQFSSTCGDVYGACCVDEVCYEVDQFYCTSQGGEWLGINMTCSDDTCAPQSLYGACCINGEAMSLFEDDCARFQGTFMGEGTDPDTVECPEYCAGDINADSTVDVEDLLIVIGTWGTCP